MTFPYFVELIALKAHAGQFRRDGKPYITHPIAVAAIVRSTCKHKPDIELLVALAEAHDLIENTDISLLSLYNELIPHFPLALVNSFIDGVRTLTKGRDEDYSDYIYRVSKEETATIVKLADLKHNLSDLPKGHRKDKYMLAEMYLSDIMKRNGWD